MRLFFSSCVFTSPGGLRWFSDCLSFCLVCAPLVSVGSFQGSFQCSKPTSPRGQGHCSVGPALCRSEEEASHAANQSAGLEALRRSASLAKAVPELLCSDAARNCGSSCTSASKLSLSHGGADESCFSLLDSSLSLSN